METLTKKDFWKPIERLYPEAFAVFSKWVDEYKIKNNWDTLFNAGIWHHRKKREENTIIGHYGHSAAPKFHDLPKAMQMGMFLEFCEDQLDKGELETTERFTPDDIVTVFRDTNDFFKHQKTLKQ